MSNIDKRALREAAEKANPEKYGFYLVEAFTELATPDAVLELLDELEAKDAKIANLAAERDALREGEMGDAKHSNTRAAADIYFQLVEECGIPAGGSLVEYVSELRERAAMLQGAEPVSNSDELPDGWVACSERMPDIGTEIFYFCQDDGLRDCGIVSSSNFSGKGDAELYVHAEGYDLRFGVDITHWMPLPAAPQQEAKNV